MTDRARPHDLRVDHLTNPLGIGPTAPRLSWQLPEGATAQEAYRIVAGDWDSGRVESADALFVPVDLAPASGRRVEWKVRTWTDLGEIFDAGPGLGRPTLAQPAPGVVVASDGAGNIHRSTDAGETWVRTFRSPGPYPDFLSSTPLVFADAQTGYFGAGAGFVVKTIDGGLGRRDGGRSPSGLLELSPLVVVVALCGYAPR